MAKQKVQTRLRLPLPFYDLGIILLYSTHNSVQGDAKYMLIIHVSDGLKNVQARAELL